MLLCHSPPTLALIATLAVAVSLHAKEATTPDAPAAPPDPAKITAAIHRGVRFLLADQRPDGSWGSAENTKGLNIYAPPPGSHHAFKAAVTSLAIMALIEAEPVLEEDDKNAAAAAIDRGAAFLEKHLPAVRRATPDTLYNVWTHAYSIQALTMLHDRARGNAERQAKLKSLAEDQADLLARYSFVGGGWSYYDEAGGTQTPGDAAFCFSTATALIALNDGKTMGVEFPERLTMKAIASIRRQQRPDFSYNYGEYTRLEPGYRERPGGSLGRSQVCNLALRLYGDDRITDDVLKNWLNRLITRNGWLSMARKRPIPHESYFGVAGYFYYYGHWYASQCIGQLPAEEQASFRGQLANILLPLQERDGSWWDYPLYNYHQQYGTAMAIMSLLRCREPAAPR